METTNSLNNEEKIFLAGCIKTMILADGIIEEPELKDLDEITSKYEFDDFDASLNSFEEKVKDKETFWQLAQEINKMETKDLILSILYELSLQSGYINKSEENLINELKEKWN